MYSNPCSCMHFAISSSPRSMACTSSRLVMPNSSAPKEGVVCAPALIGTSSIRIGAASRTLFKAQAFLSLAIECLKLISVLHAQYGPGIHVNQYVGFSAIVPRDNLNHVHHFATLFFYGGICHLTRNRFQCSLFGLLFADLCVRYRCSPCDRLIPTFISPGHYGSS